MKFERIIDIEPGFDKRDKDPAKNYGIGAAQIRFVLKGPKGAVQALFGTNWYPESVHLEILPERLRCWDVGYHSLKPMYTDHKPMDCKYVKGGKCYYDGSGLWGEDAQLPKKLVEEGSEAIWKFLEKYYNDIFVEE